MASMPVFDRMFRAGHEAEGRVALGFTHSRTAVDLEPFGHGETGKGFVDRFGKLQSRDAFRECAYDNPLDEGRPLYAPADGIVIANGSRERDVSRFSPAGTPNQGEVYLKIGVGPSPKYRETFIVYYAHLRRRLVEDGQTVRQGQILGFVGASGATGGFSHLHTGVFRASNVNARSTSETLPTRSARFGYHPKFEANDDDSGNNMGNQTAIDPLGWANPSAFDPWAYTEWNTPANPTQAFTGLGAWSIDLFRPAKRFDYP
jgi:murein DD-endopeptidase MepM/ murein hydrolase activator NlpD